MYKYLSTLLLILSISLTVQAQHSVARQWNEMLLFSIGHDFGRPTVHARNLFHVSAAMYDAWAVYAPDADTYLLGKTVHGYTCGYRRGPLPADLVAAQEEAISFAAYRLIIHRFEKSPGRDLIYDKANQLMESLGYNRKIKSTNYKAGAAQMGNYIAYHIIQYGLQDGSNEAHEYANQYYAPVNRPLLVGIAGNPTLVNFNRWQPLQFEQFIDQGGQATTSPVPAFLSAEWGNVSPFALDPGEAQVFTRNGNNYRVYHDPGPPARIDETGFLMVDEYKWNFAMVATWSSLLDPKDSVMIDISPASIGNVQDYPTTLEGLHDFYNYLEGGDPGKGYTQNPITGQPYTPQIVPRGDYTRVLAEFWADGPNSLTPPGHWFEILNYVSDALGTEKRIGGTGPLCTALEWDIKTYFTLGGAMHDAAITAWGIKGWYDGIRPVSAIKAMAAKGQSSDPTRPNFSVFGLPLIPGYIEEIMPGDTLAGIDNVFVGKIKMKSWLGPNKINNPVVDEAGVGWIYAENWWPYQRPNFVTPPFGGYISGHSTYSRAAAEVLTALTGDPYFPGGMGTFHCEQNEFLVFEDGPSKDVVLQWATYRDASDQCSLSRIYGGIHPPMDDIPGRLIGMTLGNEAVAFARQYFTKPANSDTTTYAFRIFPNPTLSVVQLEMDYEGEMPIQIFHSDGRLAYTTQIQMEGNRGILDLARLNSGIYVVVGLDADGNRLFQEKLARL